jgi:hypothetical protein
MRWPHEPAAPVTALVPGIPYPVQGAAPLLPSAGGQELQRRGGVITLARSQVISHHPLPTMCAPAIYRAPEVSANHLHGDELERASRILSLWGFARGSLVWWLMHEVSLYDGFPRLIVQIRGHDSRTFHKADPGYQCRMNPVLKAYIDAQSGNARHSTKKKPFKGKTPFGAKVDRAGGWQERRIA